MSALYSDMLMTVSPRSPPKRISAQRQRRFGFASAGGPDEHEDADRLARINEAGAAGANAPRQRFKRVILADDAGLEPFGQFEHRLNFIANHLAQRHTGPAGDDFGHDLAVDDWLHERRLALHLLQFLLQLSQLRAGLGLICLSELRRFRIWSAAASCESLGPWSPVLSPGPNAFPCPQAASSPLRAFLSSSSSCSL